jgi:hypothetical protein
LQLSGLFFALVTLAATGRPSGGPAELEVTASPSEEDVTGYCSYVQGISEAERVLLVSPQFIGFFGIVNSSNSIIASEAFPQTAWSYIPNYELILGGQYRFGRLFESFDNKAVADADCKRYRFVSDLHAIVQAYQDPANTAPALRARIAVLTEAMPHAEAILKSLRDDVRQDLATVDELNATELRVDSLRADLLQTSETLDQQAERATPPRMSAEELLAKRDAAEQELARREVTDWQAKAWDVVARVGYDRIYGVRDTNPIFGSVAVEFNFGFFFEGGASRQAAAGRRAWADAQMEGLDQRVRLTLIRARAQLAGDTKRYEQTHTLLADLEGQMTQVKALSGEKVRRYRDYLWFDLTKARADDAFFGANVRELRSWLREDSNP